MQPDGRRQIETGRYLPLGFSVQFGDKRIGTFPDKKCRPQPADELKRHNRDRQATQELERVLHYDHRHSDLSLWVCPAFSRLK